MAGTALLLLLSFLLLVLLWTRRPRKATNEDRKVAERALFRGRALHNSPELLNELERKLKGEDK